MKYLATLTIASLFAGSSVYASSHREAPAIAQDAPVDITDFYVFKPTGAKADTHVTFVMNVYPGNLAASGPNWYRFADDARYEIHIDSDGDALADVTYRFKFDTTIPEGDSSALPLAFLPGILFRCERGSN